jgi:hypothetical protein
MCTVSHCHKILPGFYRYKRCEQHRLQNRYHSKLKRVREKVVKGVGPNGEEILVDLDEDSKDNSKGKGEGKKKKSMTKREKKAKLEGVDEDGEKQGLFTHDLMDLDRDVKDKPRKRNFVCASDDCHNLLAPDVRWRHCEVCRAKERVLKRERKELEDEERKEKEEGEMSVQKEVERLRELVRRMATWEKVNNAILRPEEGSNGNGQGYHQAGGGERLNATTALLGLGQRQGVSASSEAGTTTDSVSTKPVAGASTVAFATVPASPATTTNPDIRPSAKESPETFQSVFRATPTPFVFTSLTTVGGSSGKTTPPSTTASETPLNIPEAAGSEANVPGNGNAGASVPNTFGTGENPLTFATTNTPLTFRAYKPKTATSAVGRLLAQNAELSVQVFKDLLIPGKEKVCVSVTACYWYQALTYVQSSAGQYGTCWRFFLSCVQVYPTTSEGTSSLRSHYSNNSTLCVSAYEETTNVYNNS